VTLAEYLFKKVGLRKGTRAAAFIVAWGIYMDSLPPEKKANMYGYSGYWKQSEATSYRELDVFHQAFPNEKYPDRIWAKARSVVLDRKALTAATGQAMAAVGDW
jgi:hypothetical protein